MSEIVRGVVAPEVNRERTTGEPWLLIVALSPWRRGDGPLQTSRLTLLRDLTSRDEYTEDPGLRTLVPFAVVAVRCAPGNDRYGRRRLLGVELPVSDPELEAAAAAKRPRVEHVSPTLGEIVLDGRLDQLQGARGEVKVRVHLGTRTTEEAVRAAEETVAALEPRLAELALGVADQLLELYNDGDWRNEGWPEETRESFAKRIILLTIALDADGEVTLWYHDDDLFAGHLISAVVGLDGTIQSADI